jgi:hypothetical protein
VHAHLKREVQTLMILKPGKKGEAAGTKTAVAIERSRVQVAELDRPARLHDVRFRTISLDPASEKLVGNQPSIRKELESGLPDHRILLHHRVHNRGCALVGDRIPQVLSRGRVCTHRVRVVVFSRLHHLGDPSNTRLEYCIPGIGCLDVVGLRR